MKSWTRRLEIATNVAVLATCCLLSTFVVRIWIRNKTAAPASVSQRASTLSVGTPVLLPGMNWSGSRKTVVLAISTQCHFCKESSEFYRTLTAKAAERHIPVVAVLPQDRSTVQQYLQREKFTPTRIIETQLNNLGVEGTPTLILANQSGTIERVWIGKLTPERETEVLSNL